jgi:hypothetical protein
MRTPIIHRQELRTLGPIARIARSAGDLCAAALRRRPQYSIAPSSSSAKDASPLTHRQPGEQSR